MLFMSLIWGFMRAPNREYTTTAVIFAGGVGARMRSKDLPKQFLRVHGKPIIAWTVGVFQEAPSVDNVVVVCNVGWLDHCRDIVREFGLDKVRAVVVGGETGQLSIRNGLLAAAKLSDPTDTIVLIHDGVRPLVDVATVERNVESVVEFGSSVTCVKAKETILMEKGGEVEVVPREDALLARAPQGFWLADMLAAHEEALAAGETGYIDSASMMREQGRDLHLIVGPDENIKITTQDDYYAMRAILDSRENNQLYAEGEEA